MGMVFGGVPCSQAPLLCSLHHKTASQWATLRLFPLPQCLWDMGRGWRLEVQDPADDWGSPNSAAPSSFTLPLQHATPGFHNFTTCFRLFFGLHLQSIPGKQHIVPVSPFFHFLSQLFALYWVRSVVTLKILTYMFS